MIDMPIVEPNQTHTKQGQHFTDGRYFSDFSSSNTCQQVAPENMLQITDN